jgi:hypothetical protein
MIYAAPYVIFWMRAYPLRGEVGGGWALEFPSFLGPVNGNEPIRESDIWAQNTRVFLFGLASKKNALCAVKGA